MRRKALKRNCNMKKKRRIRRKVELVRLIHRRREAYQENKEIEIEIEIE